jgi:hypothetical protein
MTRRVFEADVCMFAAPAGLTWAQFDCPAMGSRKPQQDKINVHAGIFDPAPLSVSLTGWNLSC